MDENSREIPLLNQSTLDPVASAGHLARNPAIDLVATVNSNGVLSIWRPHGQQQVSKHTERSHKVAALRWKEDGQFLAVAWSDGVVRLMGLENSKAVHYIKVSDTDGADISHVAWSRNLTGRQVPKNASMVDSWTKLLPGMAGVARDEETLDLPHELTFLEVDTALPKISPLPVSGGSGDDMFVFSTRSSLDFVFRPIRPEDTDTVDIMIVGTKDRRIHLSIYDSFVIGDFQPELPDDVAEADGLELCCHASDPRLSTHSLLLRPQADSSNKHAVYLVPIDLTFIHSSPVNLSLLASKTTTLQNLLRYIKQTQVHMVSEWKSTRELPSRFLLSVQEDLASMPKGPVSIVQALYHTVVTGHVFPPVREWLVDSLAERGHKRWEKAAVSGLESLRSLVHENMIPALERSTIILSRLLGLARFHGTKDSIGFTAPQISKLLDIVSCLTLVSHKILLEVMEELDLFLTFSFWLRFEIDKLASSSATDDISEKEALIDSVKVLTYIRRYLLASPLALYLDHVDKDDYTSDWQHAEDGVSLLEMLDKQLRRQGSGRPVMKALPNLGFLVNYLGNRAHAVLGSIAETQRRSVRFGRETKLDIGVDISKFDTRMCTENGPNRLDGVSFTAVTSDKTRDQVYIFRTGIEIINGISSVASNRVSGLCLTGGEIIDLKFLNNASLIILWSAQDSDGLLLLNVSFQSLSYAEYDKINNKIPEAIRVNPKDISYVYVPTTPGKPPKTLPSQMQLIEKNIARGELPARVCLLGQDGISYKEFALPGDWEPRMRARPPGDVRME